MDKVDYKEQIKNINSKISVFQAEIRRLRNKKLKLLEENHELSIGDVIEFGTRKKQRGTVTGFTVFSNELAPIVKLHKKDGTVGIREKVVYNWNKWVKVKIVTD